MAVTQVRGAAADAGRAGGARGRRLAHLSAAHLGRAHAVPGRQVLRSHPHTTLRQIHEVTLDFSCTFMYRTMYCTFIKHSS